MKNSLLFIFLMFFINFGYSQLISLERRIGFLTKSPIYKVEVFRNGDVIYTGINFVNTKGIQKFIVDKSVVDELVSDFLTTSFFSLNIINETKNDTIIDGEEIEVLIIPDSHSSTTKLSFSNNQKSHSIEFINGSNMVLESLVSKIKSKLGLNKLISGT